MFAQRSPADARLRGRGGRRGRSGYRALGDLILAVVHWNDFQAITTWVGQLDKAQTTLNMLWRMTKQVDPGDKWVSTNAGADYFSKVRWGPVSPNGAGRQFMCFPKVAGAVEAPPLCRSHQELSAHAYDLTDDRA